MQLKRTALPSLQLKTTSMPDEDSARPAGPAVDSARPAGHTVARQQEEEMAVEKELSAPQLAGFVDRFLPEQQVHDFRPKPETEIETSERSVRESCEQRSYRKEPATKPELQTKERKVLQYDSEDSEIDHVSELQYRKGKAEMEAKVGATRHSPPKRLNSSLQSVRNRMAERPSRKRRRSSTSTTGSTLTEDTARHREAAEPDKGRKVQGISTKKPDPAVKAQQKEVERVKKSMELKHGVPRNPNGGAYGSSHR